MSCWYHEEFECDMCGCIWDWEFEECGYTPDPCAIHAGQGDCEDCGCDWTTPTDMKININDVFRVVSEIKVNVAGTWRTVIGAWVNIAGTWRQIF